MGTMNFSIPDSLKDRFNEIFKNENKSAVIARLMQRAIEEEERRQRDRSFVERISEIRAKNTRDHFDEEIQAARDELRK